MRGSRNHALRAWLSAAALTGLAAAMPAGAATCEGATSEASLFWGDLHVHTAYSLDAYAFGSLATPKDAYDFARGRPLRLVNGEIVEIDRPLDFAAVTDHAETFEITYNCVDPLYADNDYCNQLRELQSSGQGLKVFTDFLLPVVTAVPPGPAPVCDSVDCPGAFTSQWRRTRFAANEANEPCAFTALIGYEWTATAGGRHTHRNVIFRSDQVPEQPFDYVHYPQASQLWAALAEHCRPEDGCDALAIPHNINWSDGYTFEVEDETPEVAALRARYERLAEMHQEKGSSECLPATRDAVDPDCDFELLKVNSAKLRVSGPDADPEAAWQAMRKGYYRSLLGRGLARFEATGSRVNPLMLGAIGSTDGHFGAAGRAAEDGFGGGVAAMWQDDETRLANPLYNPGGLVGVWAEENTREAIFDALKRREAYATSGTRLRLKFGATARNACESEELSFEVRMGGTTASAAPTFTVQAAKDLSPLAAIDIVKGELVDGQPVETVHRIATFESGRDTACVSWTDPGGSAGSPAYWYARVIEMPTKRWSKHLCERLDLCDQFPDADRMVEERAWSTPVWRLPGAEQP